MPRTYSEEEKQQALDAFKKHGAKKAAKEVGIPEQNIRRWAKNAGIESDALDTMANANETRRVTLEHSRLLIETQSASLATKLLAEMHRRIDEEPEKIRDQDLNSMYGTSVDKGLAMARLTDDRGATAAKSMLDRIAEQIGVPNE
ncbi:hypothetical protein [Galactobacter sp.]|uniref:hypothetical protein n=1 Tax=Galactobacter sp. TaxID=2676125 RepID=UPI0025BC6AC7|nr:hypothetical protein [Galactobacter sp.]